MPPKSRETVAAAERTRKHHTRSRAGCVTCRKRHIRCDETRPVCINCRSGSRDCEYPAAAIPLRERRANAKAAPPPGAQQVWSVGPTIHTEDKGTPSSTYEPSTRSRSQTPSTWQIAPSASIDPFDTLAIKMPFKSKQLMRYFYDTASHFGVAARDPKDDCMAVVTHDPSAMRNTLILAGLHYSWNMGALSAFESTVLHHKVECIRTINDLINDSTDKAFTTCIQQVATLTMSECCSGNMTLSYAHLRGLTAVVEAREKQRKLNPADDELDDELADRYLILVYNFVYGFKSRLSHAENFDRLSKELQRKVSGLPSPPYDPSSPPEESNGGKDNLDFRLGAIRLIPSFFAPPPAGTLPKPVDVPAFLSALQSMTSMALKAYQSPDLEDKARIFHSMWTEGTATRLFLVFVDSHRHSFYAGRQIPSCSDGELSSAWSGIATASGLYLNSVLDIWNIGHPIEPRMLRHFLLVLERDVELTRQAVFMRDSPACELWLWKAFVAALTIRRAEEAGPEFRDAMVGLKVIWDEYLRVWSRASGVTEWQKVRRYLERVTWPEEPLDEELEETAWAEVVMNFVTRKPS